MRKQSKLMTLAFLLLALLPVMTLMMTLSITSKENSDEVETEEVYYAAATSSAVSSSLKTSSHAYGVAGVAKDLQDMIIATDYYEPLPITLASSDVVYLTTVAQYQAEIIEEQEKEKQEAERLRREEEERQAAIDAVTAYACSTESTYEGYFTKYMDLQNLTDVTVEEMDYLIDTIVAGRDSELTGCGEAYIKASQETGLNPIFLLCLTAQEAGWTVSDTHAQKCNPYSICMLDDNVELGYVLGDEFSEGIVAGAIWINEHYYEEGQHSLYDFIYGSKCYSSSKDAWIDNIVSNINKCYKLLKSY